MPRNRTEGDIPQIAIATGSQDALECVLRKIGIQDSEFTNPGTPGRVHLFKGTGSPGAQVDASTPTEDALMGNTTELNSYDVVMFPCKGSAYQQLTSFQNNLINYANSGGRVFATHLSYVWLYNDPPFQGTAAWSPNQGNLADGNATVNTSFAGGQTLAQWLQLVGASSVYGQMSISTLRKDMNGVIPPTQAWLTLNDPAHGNPVMQMTFDTPIGAANQCGRVLFNEYHVENPTIALAGKAFPAECPSGAMTPQEKLLEYSLFNLSGGGSPATLTPTSADFGSSPIGVPTASKTFAFTNNSIFALSGVSVTSSGDFALISSPCSTVAAGSSCQITVNFKPTALGARTGTLTVVSGSSTLTVALTGNGTADFQTSSSALNFGNVDVGALSAAQVLTVTNSAVLSIPLGPVVASGDYGSTTTCGSILLPLSSCTITLALRPSATGARTGTVTMIPTDPTYSGIAVSLTGNGVDFSIAVAPSSGAVVAGLTIKPNVTVSPIAGFAAPVTLSCTTTTPASTCVPSATSFIPSALPIAVVISTTAQYAVVGYGGFGGNLWTFLLGISGGCFLWTRRRRAKVLVHASLFAVLLAVACFGTMGCSGKLPAQNASYTAPGDYSYTLTATDGVLTHSTTYSLKVTAR
jgi:hypothetical protein